MHNKFAETDQAKAEMLNLYFSSQTRLHDTYKDLPLLEPAQHSLNSIEMSIQDVKDVLLHLNVSKASEPISSKQLQTNISPVPSWEGNGTMYS